MFKEMRANNTIVNYKRTVLFNWQHAPDQENTLKSLFINLNSILIFGFYKL